MRLRVLCALIFVAAAVLAHATSTVDVEVKCANCGQTSMQKRIASTSSYGSGDLDMRPPPMMRWNISIHIERCPSCGYCSMDMSEISTAASVCVRSKVYQDQLNSPEFPKLANSYLCLSLIEENAEMFSDSGWSCITAAWACDDESSEAGAVKCRKRAVTLLRRAQSKGQTFGREPGAEESVLVDLLRRSSQFKEALALCAEGLKKTSGDIVADILRYQEVLIAREDTACHKVVEAGLPGASLVKRVANEITAGRLADQYVQIYGKVVKQDTTGERPHLVLRDDWGDEVTVFLGRGMMPKVEARYFVEGRVIQVAKGGGYGIGAFQMMQVLSMPEKPKPTPAPSP